MSEYLRRSFDLDAPETASAFDEMSFWSARFGAFLFEHLELRPDLTILDLACGTGFPLFELARVHGPSCRVVGLDLWPQALERAALKRRVHALPSVDLVRADAARLPFREACFDLIVSHLGINNFAAPEQALDECARVLQPGGRIVLTTNPRGHMREFYVEFRRTLRELGLAHRLDRLEANEAHRGTPSDLGAALRSRGFDVSRIIVAQFRMRYLDGGAFFRHTLTRIGFLDGWRSVVEPAEESRVFAALEARLDARARRSGSLALSVPMLYLEARRRGSSPRPRKKDTAMPKKAARKSAAKPTARSASGGTRRKSAKPRATAGAKTNAPRAAAGGKSKAKRPAAGSKPKAKRATAGVKPKAPRPTSGKKPKAKRAAKPKTAIATRPKAMRPAPPQRASIGDEAVRAKTGKTWAEWFVLLDNAGAAQWSHRDIAVHLYEDLGCPSWWSQMVTVGYEQARGLRAKHEMANGFSVSCSKTIAAPLSAVYSAWSDPRKRARWLGDAHFEVRKATPGRSMRITWDDETSVEVMFFPKGDDKAQVNVQHSRLPDEEAVERLRAYWSERLAELKTGLES